MLATNCIAGGQVQWFDEIDSTNNYLMELDDCHGKVCLTGFQSAGRGRRGKMWQAPFGSSVLMSVGYALPANKSSGLSLVCGLAIKSSLQRLGVSEVVLKWPNDILIAKDGYLAKLAGILVELSNGCCVIGVGLNVDHGMEGGSNLKQKAADYGDGSIVPALQCTDLKASGYNVNYQQLVSCLIIDLYQKLEKFSASGFTPFIQEWNQNHYYHNKAVNIHSGQMMQGIVSGVGDDGALIIRSESGHSLIYSGDVSMRAAL